MKKELIIITNIYTENDKTAQFVRSVELAGLLLYNINKTKSFNGHAETLRQMYAAFELLEPEYEFVIYADGGDSFFLRKPVIPQPSQQIIYSTEKACYPHPEWNVHYTGHYRSPWMFLNGGGFFGPIALLKQFFNEYGLTQFTADINGQAEIMSAFFKARNAAFPIYLDDECKLFQTIAFTEKNDFFISYGMNEKEFGAATTVFNDMVDDLTSVQKKQLYNNITKTAPAIIHGNGLTDMQWIYDLRP